MSTSETGNPSAAETLRPLRQTRQYRDFTPEPPSDAELDAILEVARWTGSSSNSQPWRFIVVRDAAIIRQVAEAGLPNTRTLRTAVTAIAISLPELPDRSVSLAYDDGRAAERILVAATMLGLGAGIAWVRTDVRPPIHALLGVPNGRFVRTIMAVGHPTEAARRPQSEPGQGRLPLSQVVLRNG